MIGKRRASIDTNILFYTVDLDAGERHRRATEVLDRAIGRDVVLTLQSLGEFYVAVTRKRVLTKDGTKLAIGRWMKSFPIVAADTEAFRRALDLNLDHGVAFWDALLIETARGAGCEVLLSEDLQAGRDLAGIEVIDPFSRAAADLFGA